MESFSSDIEENGETIFLEKELNMNLITSILWAKCDLFMKCLGCYPLDTRDTGELRCDRGCIDNNWMILRKK